MRIRETRVVSCAFSATIEIAKEYFDERDEPGLMPMAASSARRRRSCLVVPDHTDRSRRHEALRLSWSEHHALVPTTFEGLLTARPASGRTEVILEGEVAGHASVSELLSGVVAFVESQWNEFVEARPTIEACNARVSSMPARATVSAIP